MTPPMSVDMKTTIIATSVSIAILLALVFILIAYCFCGKRKMRRRTRKSHRETDISDNIFEIYRADNQQQRGVYGPLT